MKFEILMTVTANDADAWDLRPCSLVLICGLSGKIFLPSFEGPAVTFPP